MLNPLSRGRAHEDQTLCRCNAAGHLCAEFGCSDIGLHTIVTMYGPVLLCPQCAFHYLYSGLAVVETPKGLRTWIPPTWPPEGKK